VKFTTASNFPTGTWKATMEGAAGGNVANGYFKLLAP
jgi:hypothetical protein